MVKLMMVVPPQKAVAAHCLDIILQKSHPNIGRLLRFHYLENLENRETVGEFPFISFVSVW